MAVAVGVDAAWLADLSSPGTGYDAAVRRLHVVLTRVARAESARRAGQSGVRGPELDDLGDQAVSDAIMLILSKIEEFRGRAASLPGRPSS